jgi:HK97 family phage prohead protease
MRNDYPQAATDNAQRALDHRAEYDSECGTETGWFRARQLADKADISDEIIVRTFSFLSRAKVYDQGDFIDADGNEICGSVMYAAWGGDEMKDWAEGIVAEMKDDEARPYPNEHAARLIDPVEFETFRRENDAFGEGVDAIYGIKADGSVELQAIRFDAERWSVQDAQMWLDENGYDPILFEPAINTPEMEQNTNRAMPGELELGDFVRWNTSNGFAYGRVIEIAVEGELEADSGFVVNATEDDPAAKIRIYEYDADLAAYVEQQPPLNVVHRFSTLEKYDADVRNNVPVMERRITTQRADVTGNTIRGYAAVFNSPSEDLGGFIEYIAPGAFDSVMNDDVRGFYNHDWNYLLGRVSSGTLRIFVDEVGLGYEIDLPNTSYANDLAELMKRGDVNQSSFAFMIESDKWEVKGKQNIRTITKVSRLIDVAPVVIPAYPAATSKLVSRALDTDAELITDINVELAAENITENVNEVERPNLRSFILRIINLHS